MLNPSERLFTSFLIATAIPANVRLSMMFSNLSRSIFLSLSVRSPITLPKSLNSAFAIFDTALKKAIKN